jgi:ornithine cyclodeaminase
MLVLGDEDVRSRLAPRLAVEAARRAALEAYRGTLAAPPRHAVDLGSHELVLTVGGLRGGVSGFRAYGTWPGESDQAVLVWDGEGRLLGCVAGTELGARRTGAIGAVAADALARTDARTAGVVGSGRQARTQLWAVASVRRLERVRVFSPNADRREAFAAWARDELGLEAAAVSGAGEAVAGADVVLLATRSATPVIDDGWIEPGTHVNTVGPKTRSAHETPAALAERAAVLASDSPAQAAAYGEPFFTDRPLTHLGAILAGDEDGRRSADDVTLFCSTGLAGSEVLVAEALLRETSEE